MRAEGTRVKSWFENNTFGGWKPIKDKEKCTWAVFEAYLILELIDF